MTTRSPVTNLVLFLMAALVLMAVMIVTYPIAAISELSSSFDN